jgi:hypothetical protein
MGNFALFVSETLIKKVGLDKFMLIGTLICFFNGIVW